MRLLIGAGLVIVLASSCGAEPPCSAGAIAPVLVHVRNAETERFIAGATVRAGDVELMELSRGQYGIWSDVPGELVTASHPDYHGASGALRIAESECETTKTATLDMYRKLPCEAEIAGVRLTARDELEGAPIAGAQVLLSDGTYSERMIERGAGIYEGAYDRPGLYRVVVRADGYLDRIQEDVWAAEDDCSVLTASLDVALERSVR